jgi:hypothetical protein
MADEGRFADTESMRPVVRAVFGEGRRLVEVERLAGGGAALGRGGRTASCSTGTASRC